eukprot:jgi/Bigna1/143159/aug1.76_g17867
MGTSDILLPLCWVFIILSSTGLAGSRRYRWNYFALTESSFVVKRGVPHSMACRESSRCHYLLALRGGRDALGRRESTEKVVRRSLVEDTYARRRSPLNQACRNGSLQEVMDAVATCSSASFKSLEQLLKDRDHLQRTPLHIAAWAGRADIARFLIETARQADRNHTTKAEDPTAGFGVPANGSSVLSERRLRSSLLESLITAPAIDSTTPLHFAARAGHLEIAEILIDASSRSRSYVFDRTRHGLTPLHLAARNGDHPLAKLLLRQGGPRLHRVKDNKGQTARQHCERSFSKRLLQDEGSGFPETQKATFTSLIKHLTELEDRYHRKVTEQAVHFEKKRIAKLQEAAAAEQKDRRGSNDTLNDQEDCSAKRPALHEGSIELESDTMTDQGKDAGKDAAGGGGAGATTNSREGGHERESATVIAAAPLSISEIMGRARRVRPGIDPSPEERKKQVNKIIAEALDQIDEIEAMPTGQEDGEDPAEVMHTCMQKGVLKLQQLQTIFLHTPNNQKLLRRIKDTQESIDRFEKASKAAEKLNVTTRFQLETEECAKYIAALEDESEALKIDQQHNPTEHGERRLGVLEEAIPIQQRRLRLLKERLEEASGKSLMESLTAKYERKEAEEAERRGGDVHIGGTSDRPPLFGDSAQGNSEEREGSDEEYGGANDPIAEALRAVSKKMDDKRLNELAVKKESGDEETEIKHAKAELEHLKMEYGSYQRIVESKAAHGMGGEAFAERIGAQMKMAEIEHKISLAQGKLKKLTA